jgi:hypothetical protein
MGAGGVCGQVTVDRVILFGPGGFPGWVGFQVGGVAQLGEHLLCKQGVTGSIPVVSTTAVCVANGACLTVLARRQSFARKR